MTVKIICHMISSVDGRLVCERWSKPAEDADITTVYESAASQLTADGWIVGRTSMAQYDESVHEGAPAATESRSAAPQAFAGNRAGRLLAVVFDTKGKLTFDADHLATGEHITVVLHPTVSDEHLAALRASGVSYVFTDAAGTVKSALTALEKLWHVKTLLLEGGGVVNGTFLKEELIDELSILVYPAMDGLAAAPSIFEAAGAADTRPGAWCRLKLLSAKTLAAGAVWMRYSTKLSA